MMRVQAPAGMSSFSHQGYPIQIGDDGIAMIDERHKADFLAHGFSEVGAPRAAAPAINPTPSMSADPRRAAAVEAATQMLHAQLAKMSVEQIEENTERYRQFERDDDDRLSRTPEPSQRDRQAEPELPIEEPAVELPQGDGIPSEGRLTDAQIERMTKPQMIAWLKERDIPAVPPIDNDTLRAKVRHANGG